MTKSPHYSIVESRLFIRISSMHRFQIPKKFYHDPKERYLQYYVEATEDGVITVKYIYELPPSIGYNRIFIPDRVIQKLPQPPEGIIYECIQCRNGLRFVPTSLKELP